MRFKSSFFVTKNWHSNYKRRRMAIGGKVHQVLHPTFSLGQGVF